MRVMLATAGDGELSRATLDRFEALAEADRVRRHMKVDDPNEADVVLLVDVHALDGPVPDEIRAHPLAARYPRKIRVYDQRDNAYYSFPGLYVSASPRMVQRGREVASPYVAPVTELEAVAVEPDLLFSFIGSRSHPLRDRVLALRHPRAVVEDTTHISFHSQGAGHADEERREARAHYGKLVARSKFVLCPRGYGPSSFRIYETLAAGRVPVIVSDDWVPPLDVDWSGCSVRVSEGQLEEVPKLLEQWEFEWLRRANSARAVHALHFEVDVLWDYLMTQLASVTPTRLETLRPWWFDRQVVRRYSRALKSELARTLKERGAA